MDLVFTVCPKPTEVWLAVQRKQISAGTEKWKSGEEPNEESHGCIHNGLYSFLSAIPIKNNFKDMTIRNEETQEQLISLLRRDQLCENHKQMLPDHYNCLYGCSPKFSVFSKTNTDYTTCWYREFFLSKGHRT